MNKRQRNKILKRVGIKKHAEIPLTLLERRVGDKVADSKATSALCKFRVKEYDAGTIFDDGYLKRMKEVLQETLTIENVTGVKREDVLGEG